MDATDSGRIRWGYGVWGAFAVLVATTELLGWLASGTVGFPTISATTGDLEGGNDAVAIVVVAAIGCCAYGALRLSPARIGVLPYPGQTFAQSGSQGQRPVRHTGRAVDA